MKKRAARISIGVLVGMIALTGIIWLLTRTLGNQEYPPLFAGQTMDYWQQQLYSRSPDASNAAFKVVSTQLIPQFVDAMFHDTNDSRVRMWLVKNLNGLPGVFVVYQPAEDRRSQAAECIGLLGPAAKSVIPELIKALKGKDEPVRGAAIAALGKIHSDANTVIPLLTPYLENDGYDVIAAGALGEFGSLAEPAVPKLLPLLQAKDDDDQAAAREALKKIDPETYAKATSNAVPARAERTETPVSK